MAQINTSKKLSDKQKISSLTQENDDLFQSLNVDQSKKDQAKAVIDFAQQVINAEEFTGRDLRIYSLGIQEAVNKILKGKQAYSESMTGDAKTNIFGYYNPSTELSWMVNETVKRASKGSTLPAQQQVSMGSTPMRQYVKVTPAAGFSSYVLPNTTVDQKVKKFALHLSTQLTNYVNNPYDESKYIVEGINKDSIANFSNYLTTLREISNRTATPEDILALGDIVSALGNEDLTSAFETYFANELSDGTESSSALVIPGQKPASVLLGNATLSLAQHPDSNLNKYFADKGYSLYKDAAGNYYIDGLTEDTAEINPSSNYYKYGFFVDPFTDQTSKKTYGKLVSYGNLADDNYLSTVRNRWATLAPKIRTLYNQKFAPSDYTSQGGDKGIDFSNYLPGSDVVFIGGDKYKTWEQGSDAWMPFESWIENWEENKKHFDWEGNADVNISGNSQNQYETVNGFLSPNDTLMLEQIADIDDYTILKKFGGKGDTSGLINESTSWLHRDKTVTDLLNNGSTLPLQQKLVQYIILYLLAEKNGSGSEAAKQLEYTFPHDTDEWGGIQLGYRFMNQLRNNPELYKQLLKYCFKFAQSAQERLVLIKEIKSPKIGQKLKEGGVIKMFLGGPTDTRVAKMQELSQYKRDRSWQDLGRSGEGTIKGSKSLEENSFLDLLDGTDIARLAALGLDIASIFTSNAPGGGTLASGILGITSMLTELGADAFDKSVSRKDMWANAGMNTGFAVLGLIPDAKAMTTASKSLKFLSRLAKRAGGIGAIIGVGNLASEDIQRLNQLINNPETREFTRDDLMLIFNTIRSLTSGIALGKNTRTRKNIAKTALGDKRNIPIKDGGTSKNISVTEDQFKQIIEAGNTGGNKAAIAKLKLIDSSISDNVELPMNFGDEGGKWVRFKKAIGRNVPLHSAETSYETYGKTLKDGITKVEGIDSNIALGTGTWDPDWFGWLKHLDISKPKTESYIENGILKTRKKKSGGKLDKLQNYISNKNGK